MTLSFTQTERYVLCNMGGYSRQLVHYWEKTGYVPSKHVLKVAKLIGRKAEDLVGGSDAQTNQVVSNG